MEPGIRTAYLGRKGFERLVNAERREILSYLICKNQTGIFPNLTGGVFPFGLPGLLLSEDVHHKGGWGDLPAFTVFRRRKHIFCFSAPFTLELLADEGGAILKVNAIPFQPQNFPFPHPCKKSDKEDIFKSMSMNCLHQRP